MTRSLAGTSLIGAVASILAGILIAAAAHAETAAQVTVDLSTTLGKMEPVYRWFGYDESGYTYTPNGKRLLSELHDLSPVPVYVRAHFLLASGDGKPDLKWSSTNVYSEDAGGSAVYDWTILDQIFDAYAAAHVRPMVELGFMPEALSSHPQPYHVGWPLPSGQTEGWSYPPKDYRRWQGLTRAVAAHMVTRYGKATVADWYWEVWNEPNLSYYFRGTAEEYNRLYDYAVAGVREAIPDARVGGPATTGPGPEGNASEYLRQFLNHCANEPSAAGSGPVPLDFISFHVKGSPHTESGHVQMGLDHELRNADAGFAIVRSFAKFAALPIILSEADPEGCAACSARLYPANAYRNGPLYAAYTAAAMKGLVDLAAQDGVHLLGMLTWAFLFDGKPYFEGYRTLATNGVDKPVLNFFRMAGMMPEERVAVTSSQAQPLASVMSNGVRGAADIDALATKTAGQAAVLVWNYHDDDIAAPATQVRVRVQAIPKPVHRVLLRQYRIDDQHSNAYTVWKNMGSPQNPSASQYAALQASGGLQLLEPARRVAVKGGAVETELTLPRAALELLQLTWAGR